MKISLSTLVPAIMIIGALLAVGAMVIYDYRTVDADKQETAQVVHDESGPALASKSEVAKHA